ncbi:MAG: hypothetical protein ABR505_03415 [Actinomycetota bacterium]
MRATRAFAVVVLGALVLGACSPPAPPDQGTARSQAKRQDQAGSQKGGRGPNKKSERAGAVLTPAPGGAVDVAAGGTAGSATKTRVPSKMGDRFRFESARVEEPKPDAYKQGVAPSYAEILAVEIEGLGEDISFQVTFDGNLPDRMTDDSTYMMVGWSVTGRRERNGFGFGARATTQGWETYAGSKQEADEFPGTFEIAANTMTFTLPWEYLEGPRSFGWFATSAWVQNVGGVASYSSDPVPNGHLGKFPN